MYNQYYIGIMSGTSMDGVDAVLVQMQGTKWQAAVAHHYLPYPEDLRKKLLDLQKIGENELHRSRILAQELSHLYAQVVKNLLEEQYFSPSDIMALGCHGQTIRHTPENGYSIQLVDLPLLAELTGIFTIGDFRSRDIAAGGEGAPLLPAFHKALFLKNGETRVVLNIGGISNISVLPAHGQVFGFDTGPGNMLMDAWTEHIWQQPYDKDGQKSAQGVVLPQLLESMLAHPYFAHAYPKSTGRELFSFDWLQGHLKGDEKPEDVLRTLVQFTAQTIFEGIEKAAPDVKNVYVYGGGVRNHTLTHALKVFCTSKNIGIYSTHALGLNPQWMEAAAFGWLASCWVNRVPANPRLTTGARHSCILGAGYFA